MARQTADDACVGASRLELSVFAVDTVSTILHHT